MSSDKKHTWKHPEGGIPLRQHGRVWGSRADAADQSNMGRSPHSITHLRYSDQVTACVHCHKVRHTPRVRNKRYTVNTPLVTERKIYRTVSYTMLSCCEQWLHHQTEMFYDTIRYDSVYLTCSKKLTGSQLSLPHGTNKKLKLKIKWWAWYVRSSPVIVRQSLSDHYDVTDNNPLAVL